MGNNESMQMTVNKDKLRKMQLKQINRCNAKVKKGVMRGAGVAVNAEFMQEKRYKAMVRETRKKKRKKTLYGGYEV